VRHLPLPSEFSDTATLPTDAALIVTPVASDLAIQTPDISSLPVLVGRTT
jgi:hypothetical protein